MTPAQQSHAYFRLTLEELFLGEQIDEGEWRRVYQATPARRSDSVGQDAGGAQGGRGIGAGAPAGNGADTFGHCEREGKL